MTETTFGKVRIGERFWFRGIERRKITKSMTLYGSGKITFNALGTKGRKPSMYLFIDSQKVEVSV